VPPARDRRTSEGCPGVALRASRGTAIISLTASLILSMALRITSFGLFLIKTLLTKLLLICRKALNIRNALRRGISYSSKALELYYHNLGGEYLYMASIKLYFLISLIILIILVLYT
jgi:hypothetical protein